MPSALYLAYNKGLRLFDSTTGFYVDYPEERRAFMLGQMDRKTAIVVENETVGFLGETRRRDGFTGSDNHRSKLAEVLAKRLTS